MKTRYALIASMLSTCMLIASVPAIAGNDPIADLAKKTGLSERKVQMILGNRTSFAEYRYTYQRSLEKFKGVVGEANYQRLLVGEPVTLLIDGELRVVDLGRGTSEARAL